MTYWNILSKYGDFRNFFPSNLLIRGHVFHNHFFARLDFFWLPSGRNLSKINIAQGFFLILFFLRHNFYVYFFSKLHWELVKDVSFLAHRLNCNCFEISSKMNMI
jgi:hypothetical protein